MSVLSATQRPEMAVAAPSTPAVGAGLASTDRFGEGNRVRAEQRRRLRIQLLRVALAVGLLGTWEALAQFEIIDVFFFGQPSGIVNQLWRWVTRGTAQGPLWEQIATTLEETILG